MPDKLKSRKFWFALLGAILPVVAQYFSAEVDLGAAIQVSAGVVAAYLFGQGYVDGKALEGVMPAVPEPDAE